MTKSDMKTMKRKKMKKEKKGKKDESNKKRYKDKKRKEKGGGARRMARRDITAFGKALGIVIPVECPCQTRSGSAPPPDIYQICEDYALGIVNLIECPASVDSISVPCRVVLTDL